MNHFQATGHGQIIIALAAHRLSCRHEQNGANALATGHKAVFHSVIHLGNTLFGNTILKEIFHQLTLVFIIHCEIHFYPSKSWNGANL